MEGNSSKFNVCVIDAGRVGRRCWEFECIESVGRFRANCACKELSLRIIDFKNSRMVLRKGRPRRLNQEHQMHCVARSPDSPFAIDESPQTLLHFFSSDIKSAERIFLTGDDFQI